MTESLEDLQQVLYGIDFICRAIPNTTDAVRMIRNMCLSTEIPHIQQQRHVPSGYAVKGSEEPIG